MFKETVDIISISVDNQFLGIPNSQRYPLNIRYFQYFVSEKGFRDAVVKNMKSYFRQCAFNFIFQFIYFFDFFKGFQQFIEKLLEYIRGTGEKE